MTTLGVTCPYYGGVQVPNPANVILPTSAPSANLKVKLGTLAVVNSTGIMYGAVSLVGGVTTWAILGGASGAVATINGLSAVAGNIIIAGTANQIGIANAGHTVTLSTIGPYTPATYTAHGVLIGEGAGSIVATTPGTTGQALMGVSGSDPAFNGSPSFAGSVTAATTITATAGAITATNGNVVLGTAGNKIVVATGSNASVGTSGAMSGTPGAVTVATTASSATAKIFYSRAATGGTPGQVSITAQDGTGFTLTSTGNETSTFNWWIINA